jgi:hypothetical protein
MYDITISSVDDSVYRVGGRITSYDTWATHQWVRCDSGFSPIVGETNRFIVANQAGDYAVIVSRGSCKDTSECVSIALSNLEENELESILIFPNPTQDLITIKSETKINTARIFNTTGALISEPGIRDNKISMVHLPGGVYILELSSNTNTTRQKIIKQ